LLFEFVPFFVIETDAVVDTEEGVRTVSSKEKSLTDDGEPHDITTLAMAKPLVCLVK
jgi:hypothetical protein